MAELTLYYIDTCPYCQRVLNYLKKNNINEIELKNINKDDQAEDELIDKGGKNQVPCLMIDDRPLFESRNIVEWLKDNYK
ncbi:MAG: glutaredoxin family protein [Halanaerobiales bacterium]